MSAKEPKRVRTRRRILSTAQGLFLDPGYNETTMAAIASAADVSRASLFNYFPSKSALLDAMGHDLEARLLRALQHYRQKNESEPVVLKAMFGRLAEVLARTAPLTRCVLLQGDGQREFPKLQEALTTLAFSAQAKGIWRDDVAAKALGEMIYLALIACLLGWGGEHANGREVTMSRAASLTALLAAPPA